MKKQVRTLFTLLLALTMTLSLGVTAFAAEGETGTNEVVLTAATKGTVTVVGLGEEDLLTLYKIVDIVYDENTNTVTYAPTEMLQQFLAEVTAMNQSGVTTFEDYLALESNSDALRRFHSAFQWYLGNWEAGGQDFRGVSYSFHEDRTQEVELGQYIVAGQSDSGYVFNTMSVSFPVRANENNQYVVNKDVTLVPKKNTPTIDKSIPDPEDVQVAIGDTVTFEIVATLPQYPDFASNAYTQIGDTLPQGLAFTDDTVVTVVATTTENDWTSPVDFTDGAEYNLYLDRDNGLLGIDFDIGETRGYKQVKVTYSVEVTSDAVMTEGMENDAYLMFIDHPYDDGSEVYLYDKEKVYTYGIDVTKVDATNTAKTLADVEFTVNKQGGVANLTFSGAMGNYKYDPAGTVTTLVTDAGGMLRIEGLDVGTYEFTETKTAAGYVLPADPYIVTITDADKDGKVDDMASDNGIVEAEFTNAKNDGTLPQTGGAGTFAFVLIGLGIMAVTVIAFAVVSRKAHYNR